MIQFADDIVLLDTFEKDLQTSLTDIILFTFELNKNTEKNKSYGVQPNNIILKGNRIQAENRFEYFGSTISYNGRS